MQRERRVMCGEEAGGFKGRRRGTYCGILAEYLRATLVQHKLLQRKRHVEVDILRLTFRTSRMAPIQQYRASPCHSVTCTMTMTTAFTMLLHGNRSFQDYPMTRITARYSLWSSAGGLSVKIRG